jgi:hypothetical protein
MLRNASNLDLDNSFDVGNAEGVARFNNDGIFWRSNLLSSLDLALQSSGVQGDGPRRDPRNLRAAARYCREVAASEPAAAENLRAVAEELEAEALRNELYLDRKLATGVVPSDW